MIFSLNLSSPNKKIIMIEALANLKNNIDLKNTNESKMEQIIEDDNCSQFELI